MTYLEYGCRTAVLALVLVEHIVLNTITYAFACNVGDEHVLLDVVVLHCNKCIGDARRRIGISRSLVYCGNLASWVAGPTQRPDRRNEDTHTEPGVIRS